MKIKGIQRLLDSLLNQKRIWEDQLSDAQTHLDCLPAESLLISALATYCNLLPSFHYLQLWNSWIGYCHGNYQLGSINLNNIDENPIQRMNIKIKDDLNVQNILSNPDELLTLKKSGIFFDTVTLDKALLWKISRKPFVKVVFDPDSMAPCYIQGIYNPEGKGNSEIVCVDTNQQNLSDELLSCVKNGFVIILHIVHPISNTVFSTIKPFLLSSFETNTIYIGNENVTLHSDFKLYIVLPLSVNNEHWLISSILSSSPSERFVNTELSQEGLTQFIHCLIVEECHRELSIQQRALLADLRIHKQSVLESEVCSMLCSYFLLCSML